jgi:hypothetical protein
MNKYTCIQIYHVWGEGVFLRKIPVERRKISRAKHTSVNITILHLHLLYVPKGEW